MRILLIEDSARLRELVSETLHEAGWQVDAMSDAEAGELALALADYDLLVLDLGLPDRDGIEVLKGLRRAGNSLPVLVLTARGAVDERIAGLDAGADDYLVKPFNNGELTARIRALARRAPQAVMPQLRLGRLTLTLASGLVCVGDAPLALPPRERQLLELLMRHGGEVVNKRRIEHAFSEFGEELSANAVELSISRLRKKLGAAAAGLAIETIRGVGYLLHEVRQ